MQRQVSESSRPSVLLIVGIVRSLSCGGWVYITSTDHHDVHDILMVSYIICNVPWMLGSISHTPSTRSVTKQQRFVGRISSSPPHSRQIENTSLQRLLAHLESTAKISLHNLDSLPPSSLWPISSFNTRSTRDPEVGAPHVLIPCPNLMSHHLAYTRYSFFEWGLIFLDISFDSILATDLRESELRVRCVHFPCSFLTRHRSCLLCRIKL